MGGEEKKNRKATNGCPPSRESETERDRETEREREKEKIGDW